MDGHLHLGFLDGLKTFLYLVIILALAHLYTLRVKLKGASASPFGQAFVFIFG